MGDVVTLPVIRIERPGDPTTARELLLIAQRNQARADFEAVCAQFWQMTLINARLTDLNALLIAKVFAAKQGDSCRLN